MNPSEQQLLSSKQYDLFSEKFKANPFPTFARMRREAPIFAHKAPDGSIIWYITKYEDVMTVLRDDESFCKDPRNAQDNTPTGPTTRRSTIHQRINENMLFSDPPAHTRLRSLVSKAFTPRRMEEMRPQIETIAIQLLNQVQEQGSMDLIAAYALPLPLFVICEMLGIAEKDRDMVADWSQAIISPGSRNLNYSQRKRKLRSFTKYLASLFAERRRNPEEDLISALTQVEEKGDALNESELSSMVALLLVTGHETTVNLIGNGTLALLLNPDQLEILKSDPSLWSVAVEELLRYDGPVETSTSRWVRHDIKMGRHHFNRGDQVRVVLTSANRDEKYFENAAELDVQRQHNKHLAFGMGIHYCLGAPLARIEGEIALKTMFNRFPNLQLAYPDKELAWRSGVLFKGLKQLTICW